MTDDCRTAEAHICKHAGAAVCPHAHVRSADPRRMGPAVPSVCMCCGAGLLYWNPWGGR